MSAPHLPPVGPATASDVYTQSQETTVLTITAFTSIVDLSVVGEEEMQNYLPLGEYFSLFHDRREYQQPEWTDLLVMQVVW